MRHAWWVRLLTATLLVLAAQGGLAGALAGQVAQVTPRDVEEGIRHPQCGGARLTATTSTIADSERAELVEALRDSRGRFDADSSMRAVVPGLDGGARVNEVTMDYVHLKGRRRSQHFCVPLSVIAAHYQLLPRGRLVAVVPAEYLVYRGVHVLAASNVSPSLLDSPPVSRPSYDGHDGWHTHIDYPPPPIPGQVSPAVPRTRDSHSP